MPSKVKIHGVTTLLIAKVAISVALVAVVLRQVEFAKIVTNLSAARPLYVTACLLTAVPIITISAWRWTILAQGLINFQIALKYVLIGAFYGSILPGTISSDIARGAALAARSKAMRNVVLPASILVDRLIGLAALGAIASIGFILAYVESPAGLAQFKSALMAGAVISSFLAVLPIFIFSTWFERLIRSPLRWRAVGALRTWVERILSARSAYTATPTLLLRAIFLSLAMHIFSVLGYIFALRALNIAFSPTSVVILFSCLSMILLLPISVAGVGVREAFSLLFFAVLGASGDQAVAFSWLLLSTGLFVALIGAGVQILELHRPTDIHGSDT